MKLTDKELRQMNLSRFAKILANLSLVAILLALGGVIGYVMLGLLYVLIFALTVATFGLILLGGNPFGFANTAWEWITNVFSKTSIYIAPIAMAIAILAIVLLSKDKQENHTGRIGVCVTTIIIAIIIIVVKIVQALKGGA